MSTDHRPSVDQLLTDTSVKYRPTIGEVSAKCRRKVGEVSVNEKQYRPRHIWKDYRPCLDRVSTDYRPTLDRLSTVISTECRPTIDRVSTDYRPLYRPIDRSTLPTVNKIRRFIVLRLWLVMFPISSCICVGIAQEKKIRLLDSVARKSYVKIMSQLLGLTNACIGSFATVIRATWQTTQSFWKPQMQKLCDRNRLSVSVMSHFLPCGDKLYTRL